MAKTTGVASIATGRSDIFKIDPAHINIRKGWNGRDFSDPDNIAHINELALSIAEVGVKEPITVVWEDNKVWLADGECRLRAALQAIKAGAPLKSIPVKTEDRYADEPERLFNQILRNSGKPFSVMEKARIYKRLTDLGWTQDDIAKKEGKTAGRISQIMSLLTHPQGIQDMVVKQQVSPTMATQVVKEMGGTEAEKALRAGLQTAKAEGKDKVGPSHVAGSTSVGPKANIKTIVSDAFEYSDVDDTQDEFVIIKMPVEKWDMIKDALKL